MEKILVAIFFTTAFISCSKKETEEIKPNIVIVLTDDQGWGDLSHTGNSNLSTPNIDAIAKNGVTFNRFYVSAVCSPTRAELLTGRHHVRGGVYSTGGGGERLDLDETTIGDVFQQAGYKTAAFGKWHNGMQYPYHPNGRGFDEYYGFCSGHWGNYFSPMLEHNGEIVKGDGFVIDDFTNKAIEFIESNKESPFLVYLPFNTPHSPMQVPDKWFNKFKDKDLPMLHRDASKEDIEFTRAALAMCENIDWNVGRLTQKLKELELEENTILLYFSDNGPNSWRWNGGMKGRKGSTDEGGVRSPLVMQWPGKIRSGHNIMEISSVMDLMPTLADMAGIAVNTNKPVDGISLKPLILEDGEKWQERIIINHWKDRTSARNQGFRLDKDNNLFDMEEDPGQKEDVSNKHPEIKKTLLEEKDRWIDEVLAELPQEETRSFPLGHPDFIWTQVPARDGVAHGNIKRSNRWPNCSYFTNWLSVDDKITWEMEVFEDGKFEVELYYTCAEENVGTVLELSFGDNGISKNIDEAHNPTAFGMADDLIVRQESYVKDFKPISLGEIQLKKGKGVLTLQATEIPGAGAIDFRLLMFKRIDSNI
ncbi:MAG: arylsulfatase [Cyclobacteriaceae bacterium]